MNRETEYDGLGIQDADSASQVIQIESGKHVAAIVICAIICGMSVILSWWAMEKANRSEERADLLQYYVLEMDSKLIAAGVKGPEDAVSKKLAEKQ